MSDRFYRTKEDHDEVEALRARVAELIQHRSDLNTVLMRVESENATLRARVADLEERSAANADHARLANANHDLMAKALKTSRIRAETAESQVAELSARLERAREVIEPFAEVCSDVFNDWCPDDTPAWSWEEDDEWCHSPVTTGHFRAARDFLKELSDADK